MPRPGTHMRCPVIVRGVEYPSITAAAQAIGVVPSAITNALRLHGHADNVGMRGIGRHNAPKRPLTILGRSFPSVTAAARFLGLPRSTLQGMIGNPASAERLLVLMMQADCGNVQMRVRSREHDRDNRSRNMDKISKLNAKLKDGKQPGRVTPLNGSGKPAYNHHSVVAVQFIFDDGELLIAKDDLRGGPYEVGKLRLTFADPEPAKPVELDDAEKPVASGGKAR